MSTDYYYHVVRKVEPPIPTVLDENDSSFGSYYIYRKDRAEEWMKSFAQLIPIKRRYRDIFKACEDHFGKPFSSATYLFKGGYEYYDKEGNCLGRLYDDELEKYRTESIEEEYVFQGEQIAYGDCDYAVCLKEGLVTAEELFTEIMRLAEECEDIESSYYTNPIIHLLKAYSRARKGETIWFHKE